MMVMNANNKSDGNMVKMISLNNIMSDEQYMHI